MKVKSVDVSARRYVQNSTRAFAEGLKDERWLLGVVRSSGLPEKDAHPIVEQELADRTDARTARLLALILAKRKHQAPQG